MVVPSEVSSRKLSLGMICFYIWRFFGTFRRVVNDEDGVLEIELDPTKHMESSVGEK